MINKLEELINKIQAAKDAYYNSGDTIMSDAEYDKLVDQAAHLGYIETVGSKAADALPKITHDHLMLSLDKVHTIEDVDKFIGNRPSLFMYKLDGLTCSATYNDGILVRLETRGDGYVGNDIMVHAKSFDNLPLTIDRPGKYVVDGEAIILRKDFDKINEKLPEDQKYKNPRNLAAGTLNLLDPTISRTRHLKFYVWDVIDGHDDTLQKSLDNALDLGFDIAPYAICRDNSALMIPALKVDADEDGVPIDGIVIKYNDMSLRDTLGHTGHHFQNAKAYKYEDETYPTKLIRVEWTQGKTGQLTPVAIFEPVVIDGTVVEKASMHNISIMKQLHPTIGCTCYIYKANQIIPQVDFCEDDGIDEIDIPTICPTCGGVTNIVKDNQSEVLMCTNPNCSGKLLGRLKHFVSKKGMDIDGLSEATLSKFIDLGWLNNFTDIYRLPVHYKQIINLDGFGRKSADNLLEAMGNSRQNVKLENFITALSIPGIGEGQTKVICKKYPTWHEFCRAVEEEDLTQIDGIGDVLNRNIKTWFADPENIEQAFTLAGIMEFAKPEFMNKPTLTSQIAGLTFVVTGSVEHFKNRDELKTKIESLGGKCAGSVSKKTDYLINNDVSSTSGKNKKAIELNIPIISEEDFLELIKK